MLDIGARPEWPIRVTHIVFDLHGGGMESLVAALAQRFASSSVAMPVISLSGRAGRLGTAVRPLLDQFHVLKPMAGVSMVAPLGLVRCLRSIRPDVAHVHSGAWYKGVLAARLAGVRRVVYTEHGREPHETTLTRWLDQRAVRWTDVVVAVSDCLRRHLETALHVPPHRIQTIENCIDVEVFTPGPRSQRLWDALGIPRDAFVIGSVGRLESVKAFERMIETLARIRSSGEVHRPVYLVICGEGSQRQALEECARHWGVAEGVRFPGWVDQPVAVYRSLDVFALTSLSEGASISLMEAIAEFWISLNREEAKRAVAAPIQAHGLIRPLKFRALKHRRAKCPDNVESVLFQ